MGNCASSSKTMPATVTASTSTVDAQKSSATHNSAVPTAQTTNAVQSAAAAPLSCEGKDTKRKPTKNRIDGTKEKSANHHSNKEKKVKHPNAPTAEEPTSEEIADNHGKAAGRQKHAHSKSTKDKKRSSKEHPPHSKKKHHPRSHKNRTLQTRDGLATNEMVAKPPAAHLLKEFQEACQHNNLSKVQELLVQHQFPVNTALQEDGATGLHFACRAGHLELVQCLMKQPKAHVNQPTSQGKTLLHLACYNGDLEMVSYLLQDKNADTQAKDEFGKTPLDLAREQGQTRILKYFEKPTPFQAWLQTVNQGKKTSLEQQIALATQLYNEAFQHQGKIKAALSPQEIIQQLEQTPINNPESLVAWQGIRVKWFLNEFCQSPYMQKLRDYGCELWFIRKVCIIEIIRRTSNTQHGQQQPSGPFANHIQTVAKSWDLSSNKNLVQKPTTFISYTGAYTLDFFIQGLEQLDPEEFVWMDIFCVDQFAWTGKGRSPEMYSFKETFTADLQNQVHNINNTALMLAKWDDVMYTLEQIWVLWEIFNTAKAQANLRLLLSDSEMAHFVKNCLESNREYDSILASIAAIDVSKAKAEDDGDRNIIFQQMEAEDGGLDKVNKQVCEVIWDWLSHVGRAHLSQLEKTSDMYTDVLNNLALLLENQGKYDEAASLCRECLSLREGKLGRDHPDTLTTIRNLASLLHEQGKYEEAEPLYRECLLLREQKLGRDHPTTLLLMNNLALLLDAQEKFDEAESLYRHCLGLQEKKLGREHTDTLSTMNNFAMLLKKQGKTKVAEPLYRECFHLSVQILGKGHQKTLASMNNLALLLDDQGKHDEAKSLLRECLSLQEQKLGRGHPDALSSIGNLALLLKNQGMYDEAEQLYRECLLLREQKLGRDHPDTLTSMNNLARLLDDQGRYDEAEPLYRECLLLREQTLGRDHPDTLTCMNNLAMVLRAQETYEEAETFCKECLSLTESKMGSDHENSIISMSNLASIFYAQGKYDEAEPLYRLCLTLREQKFGRKYPDSMDLMNDLALVLQEQEKYNEAELLQKDCLSFRRQELGDHHPDTLSSINNLAFLIQEQERYKDAEPLYREILTVNEANLGQDDPITLESTKNLAVLLYYMDQSQEALQLLQDAYNLCKNSPNIGSNHPCSMEIKDNLDAIHAEIN